MIFSHGVASGNHCFWGVHKEFASHGYIVFVPDHLDGSANYTELPDGTPKPFNSKGIPHDLEERRKQSQQRGQEIVQLIDEISQPGYLQQVLNFPQATQLDLDNLIMNGHSFGGGTSIMSSIIDQRIKCCLAIDPWFFPYQEE